VNTYILTGVVIFSVIALLHLLRIVFGWEVVIGGWNVPPWLSVAAFIIAGYLGYAGLRLSRKA
jgi:hypothetical protein